MLPLDPAGERRECRYTANFTRTEAAEIETSGYTVRELILLALKKLRRG